MFGEGVDVTKVGTIGAWVGGIGSIAAVCVALYLAGYERREQMRLRVAAEVNARTRVFSWVANLDEEDDDRSGWHIFISNQSGASILRWKVVVSDADSNIELGIVNTSAQLPLQPGVTVRRLAFEAAPVGALCRLEFIDSVGDCWIRQADGSMQPLDEIEFGGRRHRSVSSAASRCQYREPLE